MVGEWKLPMRIYLDACALNRLTDDPSQLRIRLETGAMREVFRLIEVRSVQWTASSILESELKRNPDMRRRLDSLAMLRFADEMIHPDTRIEARANHLHKAGYGRLDAFHVALAEGADVNSFLTTDDRFLRKIQRGLGMPLIQAENPLNWIKGDHA
jgi:predicted nucleic acid-binding protein